MRPAAWFAVLWSSVAMASPVVTQDGEEAGLPGLEGPVLSAPVAIPGSPPSAYIVAGAEVDGNEFDSVVYLEMEGAAGESSCTGSLIHRSWILTAAHCVDDELITEVRVNFGNRNGAFFKTVEAESWIVHRDWDGEDDFDFEGDVALIKLATPVDDIFPMALNKQEVTTDWLDLDITFIGFGITEFEGGGGGIKRFVATPVTSVPENGYEIIVYDGVHSTCQGDSGGPGILYSGTGYTQVSVTSYGVDCGDGISGVMRVDTYLPWIRSNMAPDEPVTKATAPPTFRCSHEQVPGDPGTIAIGTTPLELKCVVDFYAPENITEVTWAWGDGGITEVLAGDPSLLEGTHSYDNTGNYNVKMCVKFTADGRESSHCADRRNYVRACGAPEAAFSYDPVDTRTLQFVNLTDIKAYGCIFDVAWEVYEGDSASGEPVDVLKAWAPEYRFESSGDYTVVLNVGGIGGTGAATLPINVGKATRGSGGCDTLGGSAGLALALGGLLALRRRRG